MTDRGLSFVIGVRSSLAVTFASVAFLVLILAICIPTQVQGYDVDAGNQICVYYN